MTVFARAGSAGYSANRDMKIARRPRINSVLTQFALRFADALDTTPLGKLRNYLSRIFPSIATAVSELRNLREHQLSDAKKSFNESRIPDGAQVRFLGFCLFEVFTLEQYNTLDSSTEGLMATPAFLGLNDSEQPPAPLRERLAQLSQSSAGPGGVIVRDRSLLVPEVFKDLPFFKDEGAHFQFPSMVMPELPGEVLFILIQSTKVLPSLMVTTAFVHLKEEATERLLKIHNKEYPAPIRLRGLNSHAILRSITNQNQADRARATASSAWRKELRTQVETSIRPFVKGYFSKVGGLHTSGLPVVEVFSLKGAPEITSDLESQKTYYEWVGVTMDWTKPLGIDLLGGESYLSELGHFRWATRSEATSESLSTLTLWEEACEKSIRAQQAKGGFFSSFLRGLHIDGENELMDYAVRIVSKMVPGLAIGQTLNVLRRSIEKLRLEAFGKPDHPLKVRSNYSLINSVMRDSIFLDRIHIEFDKERFWPVRGLFDLAGDELEQFKRISDESFKSHTENDIRERIELLRAHLGHVQLWLNQQLSVRNTRAMYWLTVTALVLTFAALVLGLVTGWQPLGVFVKRLRG